MILPCIEKKCIKYPACKHKKFITCSPFREYCDEIGITKSTMDHGQDVWDIIYLNFPELLAVDVEHPPKDSDITNVYGILLNRRKMPMEFIKSMTWEPKK